MEYKFFISYFGTKNDNSFGFGNSEIMLNKKIKSFDDIECIEKELTKINAFKKITIINYQLMEVTKKEVE